LPSHALLQEIKEGPNPELANLHNKRFVVCTEPEKSKKINCSAMKKITGDRVLPVRSLYSADCETILALTLVMECNEDPVFDEVNPAVLMRIRNSLFQSTFYTEAEYNDLDDESKKTAVLGDPYYKTEKFRDEFKCVLFDLLRPYFKKFQENQYKLKPMPKECAMKCNKYLAVSDDIYGWFSEFYEKTDKIEESEAISFTDIFSNFKNSEFFENLNKADKRKYNRKYFCEQIEKNMFLKKFVKLRNSHFNGTKLTGDSIVGWKKHNVTDCVVEKQETIEEMR
jgi:phage/plasmid-associated DNA primase